MIALPDVNVLLALAWSNHVHHNAAHDWFAQSGQAGWATCLWTQSAFLRLSLNPQVVGVSISCRAGMNLLRGLVAHPHHQYIEAAPGLSAPQFDELIPRIAGYRQVSDAVLLYLARVHDLTLITFDQAAAAVCAWQKNLQILTP